MKKLLFSLLFLFSIKANAQIANAGADQTIYLTQTSTAILNGSASSGTSYQWTDISTDIINPATIVSPKSATTNITGLTQGVWYYQLAVTTGGTTKYDSVNVMVDYDLPPTGSTFVRELEMSNPIVYKYINNRTDTTQLTSAPIGVVTAQGTYIFDRCRSKSMMIDSSRGKFYTTIEDGYHWQSSTGYARTEVSFSTGFVFDTTHTYCLEWKGYYPQGFSNINNANSAVTILQIHTNNVSAAPSFAFQILGGNLTFMDSLTRTTIAPLTLFNDAHTIRVTFKEGAGYTGQTAFMKVEVDGVQKFYRGTGKIGSVPTGSNIPNGRDWNKLASLYDYNNAIVNPDSLVRGRKFSLVTEAYRVYILNR